MREEQLIQLATPLLHSKGKKQRLILSDAKLGPKDTVFVRQYCKVEGLYVQNVLSYYGFEVPKGTVFITFGRRSHSKTIQ